MGDWCQRDLSVLCRILLLLLLINGQLALPNKRSLSQLDVTRMSDIVIDPMNFSKGGSAPTPDAAITLVAAFALSTMTGSTMS